MLQNILDHYLKYGTFTYPGLYEEYLKTLPDNVLEMGKLVRWSIIHRTTLEAGNVGTNSDLKYGDMAKVPWYQQPEDDYLTTSTAILAELFRKDDRGLTMERNVEDKVVLTCRYVAILMASILKSKAIPCRVRSGFASYWEENPKVSADHWINEYWNNETQRWVRTDVDGSLHNTGFDMYDIPDGKFDYSADTWLSVRKGETKEGYFYNAGDYSGLVAIAWELFYDFHCLMNSEIMYLHHPEMVMFDNFKIITETQLKEIDELAKLMQNPDKNFDELQTIWETNKEFRLLKGGLL